MSSSSKHVLRIILTTAVITTLALAAVAAKGGPGSDGAANKVAASGAAMKVWGPGTNDGVTSGGDQVTESEEVELLSASVKLSTPEDLILSVALECSISTELFTVGNSSANASGTVEVWIEIDGQRVPVSTDDTGDTSGHVTYCNRAYGRTTTLMEDEEHAIRSHINTKQSHSFNWLALDEIWAAAADDNIHDISVMARLEQSAGGADGGDGTAIVTVGKRTLIIEPTKVANGETVEMN